jgi:hypothetical protein
VQPPQPGCTESDRDNSISVSFTVPYGWAVSADGVAIIKAATGTIAPAGMSLHLLRGGWTRTDPCITVEGPPDIPVGPTVGDFASALTNHPLLDATTPIDGTLGGYSGKYIDLQVPSDISTCTFGYYPWEPAFYAQGPSNRWHVWILDVDGVRVVVQSGDFAGTSAQDLAEMHGIIESIRIAP